MNEPQKAPATTIRPNIENYVTVKSGNGKRTHRTDDFVARTLDGKTLETVITGCGSLGIENKWGHLNPGQQRMLLGNALRQATRRTKDTLSESAITAVFGEPAAPYDEEAAAKAKADAIAAREQKAAEAAAKREQKAADAAAKKEAKAAAAAEKAEKAEKGETAAEAGGEKPKTKAQLRAERAKEMGKAGDAAAE